jgi:hypothetical protein
MVCPPELAPGLPWGVKASLMSRLRRVVQLVCDRANSKATGRTRGFIIGQTPADCAAFLNAAGASRPAPLRKV